MQEPGDFCQPGGGDLLMGVIHMMAPIGAELWDRMDGEVSGKADMKRVFEKSIVTAGPIKQGEALTRRARRIDDKHQTHRQVR